MSTEITTETVVKLSITVAQAGLLRTGLLELPAKAVLETLADLDRQVNAQLTALAEAQAQAQAQAEAAQAAAAKGES